MRSVGSSHVDPYSAIAAACAALYGPLHGGANEAVLRMLSEIGSVEKIPAFIKRVKDGENLLMGFGHRVYKNFDPRASIIKELAHQVFEVTGRNPLLDIGNIRTVSAVMSGISALATRMCVASLAASEADSRAWPVPLGSVWMATVTPSPISPSRISSS